MQLQQEILITFAYLLTHRWFARSDRTWGMGLILYHTRAYTFFNDGGRSVLPGRE
jgi:hypothetical protein